MNQKNPSFPGIKNIIKAWLMIFLNRSQEAYDLAQKTLEFTVLTKPETHAELELILAQSAFDLTQFPLSAKHATTAINLLEDQSESRLHIVASLWLGASRTQQSQYLDASEILNSVHERALNLGEPYLCAVARNYLAIIQEELGNMAEAFVTYNEAINFARAASDSNILGRILANVGEAYVNLGLPKPGLKHLTEAVVHLKTTHDRNLIS